MKNNDFETAFVALLELRCGGLDRLNLKATIVMDRDDR